MKYKCLLRRWGAGALSAVLLLSGAPAGAVSADANNSSLFRPDSGQLVSEDTYAPDDRVRIMIELEDAPLLDDHRVSQYASASDFLDSRAAQSAESKLMRARKAVKSEMDAAVDAL